MKGLHVFPHVQESISLGIPDREISREGTAWETNLDGRITIKWALQKQDMDSSTVNKDQWRALMNTGMNLCVP